MRAMNQLATSMLGCVWVLAGCGSTPPHEERLGTATLAMVNAPPDARCAQVTIAGETTEVRKFPLVPSQPAVFTLDDLPTGPVTFSEQVFTQACASIGSNNPKWISNEVDVELEAGVGVDVYLTLSLFGEGPSATVHTDFPETSVNFETINMTPFMYRLVVGSDDNVWASGYDSSFSGYAAIRITPGGVVTSFPLPTYVDELIAGSDGNLWGAGVDEVVRVTPTGSATIVASSPGAGFYWGAAGSDGNVWFSHYWESSLSRVTVAGTITEFALPGSYPGPIATGADGRLWTSEHDTGKIARVTTSGTVTEFTPPSPNAYAGAIAAGPDGNVWFTETNIHKVARVTPGGSFAEFSTPSSSYPYHIAAGSDGNLWVTGNGVLIRVTPQGSMKEIALPPSTLVNDIISGPDGKLWISSGTQVVRLDPSDVE
jgi:virginiamycin B lyase